MVKVENFCVDCDMPCRGSGCPLREVEVHYCDECGEELGKKIYEVEGMELCEECLKEMFLKR